MHDNSRAALVGLRRAHRRAIILSAYRGGLTLTDRDVCAALGLPDMNCVRPRITELVHGGELQECGWRLDSVSGRRVRVCRLTPAQMELAV